jgi:hypothetical protein
MYYRRKLILGLLEVFGGQLERLRFQKLLFLLTRSQQNPTYDFVPYKYGCFSFSANADLCTMQKYAQVAEEGNYWKKTEQKSYLTELSANDRSALLALHSRYKSASADDLIRLTYRRHPWFATNSTIKEEKLDKEELAAVEATRATDATPMLFTIGYEGISLEAYLTKLLKNNVKILCDVRRNPLSMKYGFSKKQLENACKGVNITYTHVPGLGIESEKRQSLSEQKDYDILFAQYARRIQQQPEELAAVQQLIEKHGRVALTCFEAKVCQCHRGTLAQFLASRPGWPYSLRHL